MSSLKWKNEHTGPTILTPEQLEKLGKYIQDNDLAGLSEYANRVLGRPPECPKCGNRIAECSLCGFDVFNPPQEGAEKGGE